MRGRWASATVVAVGQLVAWGALYYAYAVLAPSLVIASGTSSRIVALAFSLTLLVSGLAARAIGRALDHGRVRVVFLAGAVAGPAALLAIATVSGPATLWGAFILLGVAQALALYEPAFRVIVQWFPEEAERRRALLLVTSVGGFASTIFVPLISALVDADWRMGVFVLAAILMLVALPTALLVSSRFAAVSPHAAVVSPHTAVVSPHTAVVSPHTAAVERAHVGLVASSLVIAHDRGSRRLAFAFSAHAFASAAVAVALLWHLIAIGEPPLRAAFLVGLVGAAQVPGRIAMAVMPPEFPERWRLTLIFCVQATALACIAVASGALLVASLIVFGAASGALTLERPAVTARWYGVVRFGTVSGRLASYALGGRAVAPIAIEVARESVGYGVAFAGTAALLLLGGAVFLHASTMRERIAQRPMRLDPVRAMGDE